MSVGEPWTNWSGSVSCIPHELALPDSEEALAGIIRRSAASGRIVRTAGTGHSFLPLCSADGALISLDRLQGLTGADHRLRRATFRAGTKIHQMGEPLFQEGMAMSNMGDIDRQSLAGAVSTGTHGTGRGIGSISTQVVELRLILASGEVVELVEEADPAHFKATQVALGALGVISRMTLQLVPAFRLHERTWVMPVRECLDQLQHLIETNRSFEFFWSPKDDACAAKSLNPTDLLPSALESENGNDGAKNTGNHTPGRFQRYVGEERIGNSYEIIPSERNVKFNETEFAVPEEHGPECFLEIRKLMRERFPGVTWPIEYRTLGADDIWLSPAYERDSVTISVHQAAELPCHEFFAEVEAIFRSYHGRPHWGKIHTHSSDELRKLYTKWDRFQKVRREFDPEGVFLNPYLRKLFGV